MLVEEDLCDDPRSVFLSAAQRPEPQSLRLVERDGGEGGSRHPRARIFPGLGTARSRRQHGLCGGGSIYVAGKKCNKSGIFFFFLESLLLNVYLAACHCQSSFLTSCTRPPPTQLPSRHRRVSPRGCSRRSWREPVVFLSFFFFFIAFLSFFF